MHVSSEFGVIGAVTQMSDVVSHHVPDASRPLVDRLAANLASPFLGLLEVQNMDAISVHNVVGNGEGLNDILLVPGIDPDNPLPLGSALAVAKMETLTDSLVIGLAPSLEPASSSPRFQPRIPDTFGQTPIYKGQQVESVYEVFQGF